MANSEPIAAQAARDLFDALQAKGVALIGFDGFVRNGERLIASLTMLIDFSADAPAKATARAHAFLRQHEAPDHLFELWWAD